MEEWGQLPELNSILFMVKREEKLKTGGKKRSNEWPKVRKAWLAKHPKCYICGSKTKIEVHHCRPFNVFPESELDINNLITLCESQKTINCHLIFGHWKNYRLKYNPHVKEDAKIWRKRILLNKKMI